MTTAYPLNIRLEVHLSNGDVILSKPILIRDEDDDNYWGTALRNPKKMEFLKILQDSALGKNEDTIIINPTYIAYVRIIEEE